MTLWGNLDNPTGNQKPKFANTSNSFGGTADSDRTYGVSVTEKANTQAVTVVNSVQHAGWSRIVKGTGPILSVTITNPGAGINANGFLTITGAGGQGANLAFIATSNLTNSSANVITSVLVVNGGSLFNSAPIISFTGANTVLPTFTAVMGGRVGRVTAETLVAMGSITGDDSTDDSILPGL